MKPCLLKELKYYTFSELQTIFELDEEDLEEFLKSLSLLNIVRQKKQDIDFELEDLLDLQSADEFFENSDESIFVFTYVGILQMNSLIIIIYPKYIDNYLEDKKNNYAYLKLILKVIRKYNSKSQNIGFGESDINNFNLLSLALELFDDYYESGLYVNEKDVIDLDIEGEINWSKTINETPVFLVDNTPMYLNTYNYAQIRNESDFYTLLHGTIISKIENQLEEILEIMGIEKIHINNEELNLETNDDYFVYRVNQEISNQFITYKQKKLQMMKRYLLEHNESGSLQNISFVGTTSFNLVWESVCAEVHENKLGSSLKELGLKYEIQNKTAFVKEDDAGYETKTKSHHWTENTTISEIIDKPIWTHNESNKQHYSHKTLIPDIISIDTTEKTLKIYDAKYYTIKLDENGVRNQPGISDVSKQYLYELSYLDFSRQNNLTISKNAFLMPSEGHTEEVIGKVNLEMFSKLSDQKFNDIEVILVPSKNYYEKYLEL